MPQERDTPAVPDTPSVADVQRIAVIPDPVLRNLAITHCYSRLAAAVARRTGAGANWCTFATWASRQAGSTIRGEDAVAFLRRRLARRGELLHPVQWLWRSLLRRGLLNPRSRLGRLTAQLHTPFDALERAGDAVARGNKKVFEEIGLQFARFLEECPPDARVDSPEMRAFLDGLRPGDPPDGQRYLREAFLRYQRQRAERTPKVRAELLLAANLEIGLHEQTRLQPEIREALDAPYATQQDLGRRLLELLLASGTRARRAVPDRPAAAALGWVARKVQDAGAEIAREVITESFMVLSLPGRVLALGAHLPDAYPEPLRQVADQDLAALIARFEPIAPVPDDCGARDWAVLEQRMHYIVHLFRATHEHAELYRAPFTPAQVSTILAGVIPDGDLG
jgi:hypothetical protein